MVRWRGFGVTGLIVCKIVLLGWKTVPAETTAEKHHVGRQEETTAIATLGLIDDGVCCVVLVQIDERQRMNEK
jgi:hypothetical protein